MATKDRTEERNKAYRKNQSLNGPLLLDGHLIGQSEDTDEVFSFDGGCQSRKRILTPDFTTDHIDTTLESPLHNKGREVDFKMLSERKIASQTLSTKKPNVEEKFFKFCEIMKHDGASPDVSRHSLACSPDVRRKFSHQLPLVVDAKFQLNLQSELSKSKKLTNTSFKHSKRFLFPGQINTCPSSPQKEISQSFTIFKQQVPLVQESSANLLEFAFNRETDALSLDNKSSIEDDIVTTPSRHKELSRKPFSESDEFRIALYPAELELDKIQNTKFAIHRLNCEALKRNSHLKRGNLVDFSGRKSICESFSDQTSLDSPLLSPRRSPSKHGRIFIQRDAIYRLTSIFDTKVKTYFSCLGKNGPKNSNLANLLSKRFSLRLISTTDQKDTHPVKSSQLIARYDTKCPDDRAQICK